MRRLSRGRCPLDARRRQRGAMAMGFVAVFLIGVFFAALAIDVGRWYMEDRRLQKAVDNVTMELAARAGYCAGDDTALVSEAAVQDALDRQGLRNPAEVVLVRQGRMETEDGLRRFIADPGDPEALLVRARQQTPRSIIAATLFPGSVTLEKTAVARRVPVATFSVGSWLLRVDEDNVGLVNALLGGLIGASLNADVVSYRGLADARVSLGDLLEAGEAVIGAEAGTVDGLLDADISLGQLGDIAVEALQRSGQSAAEITALIAQLGVDSLGALRIGDILALDQGSSQSALDAAVSVGDLLFTGLMVANERNAVDLDLDGLSLNLLNLLGLSTTARLAIIEAPQIAMGRPGRGASGEPFTQARNAQLRLQLELDARIGGMPGSSLIPSVAEVPLRLALEVARATATLEDIDCRRGVDQESLGAAFSVDASAVDLRLGTFDDITATGSSISPQGSGIVILGGLVRLDVTGDIPVASMQGGEIEVSGIRRDELPLSLSTSQSGGSSLIGPASGHVDVRVSVLGLDPLGLISALLGAILNTLTTAVLGLLDAVIAQILNPLLDLLGVNAAGADVELIDIDDGRTELVL